MTHFLGRVCACRHNSSVVQTSRQGGGDHLPGWCPKRRSHHHTLLGTVPPEEENSTIINVSGLEVHKTANYTQQQTQPFRLFWGLGEDRVSSDDRAFCTGRRDLRHEQMQNKFSLEVSHFDSIAQFFVLALLLVCGDDCYSAGAGSINQRCRVRLPFVIDEIFVPPCEYSLLQHS